MIDFKSLTLELYNHNVKVMLKPDTEISKEYGKYINGILMRRIWNEQVSSGRKVSTVIGITIQVHVKEIDIMCSEIADIEKLH